MRTLVAYMIGQSEDFAVAVGTGNSCVGDYAPPKTDDRANLLCTWDNSVDRLLCAWERCDKDRSIRLEEISADVAAACQWSNHMENCQAW